MLRTLGRSSRTASSSVSKATTVISDNLASCFSSLSLNQGTTATTKASKLILYSHFSTSSSLSTLATSSFQRSALLDHKTALKSTNHLSTAASPQWKQDKEEERELVTYVTLNTLADNPGAIKKKRRVGRGIGSSKGKTCGRGHKGQKARSGGKRKVKPGFEGGQTKLYKRLPKRGFNNKVHAEPMTPINLGDLQDYIDMKRLSTTDTITMKDLVDSGLTTMSSVKFGIKLLAKGKERFRTPIKIEVSRASRTAIEAIESVGGEIMTVHFTRLSLRALMKPHKFEDRLVPRRALPHPKMMTYYNNYENRGYLSPQMQKKKLMERLKLNESNQKSEESEI